jgi:prolyl 4-hydroxylase
MFVRILFQLFALVVFLIAGHAEDTNEKPRGQRSISFVNKFNFDVEINWKGVDAVSKITEIPALSTRNIFSYNGHIFFATAASDNMLRVGPKTLIIVEDTNQYVIAVPAPKDVCEVGDDLCAKGASDEKDDDDEDEDEIDILMKRPKEDAVIAAAAKEAAQTGVKIARGSNTAGKAPEVDINVCNDRHDACPGYTKSGECTRNPGWMIVNCPKSCNACDLRDPKVRCDRGRLNITTAPVYAPGDLHSMFAAIEEKWGDAYGINVLSTEPWVVTFDNFLSEEEADALIETNKGNWERSTDTGSVNAFGETGRVLSVGRTSSNAWCRSGCLNNPHVQNVMKKIEDVTMVPRVNFESFQVLQYEIGQKYNVHHDMSPRQTLLSCGPRILTFFLYLSDVEEGGETGFPRLGIDVKPKKGKALLWPSTMDSNLEQMDPRTHHEAKPVVVGKKFAANTWIHLYDFETSNLWGCTGTFD